MSYRAFKRLLGETSLERKFLFLFGMGTLVLISAIFWWYANRTEYLAYERTAVACRLLANHWLESKHEKLLLPAAESTEGTALRSRRPPTKADLKRREDLHSALEGFSNKNLPEVLQNYTLSWIKPNPTSLENQPQDSFETRLILELKADPEKLEASRLEAHPSVPYYNAIRAEEGCLKCHEGYQAKDLMAVVRVSIPSEDIRKGVHVIRAYLIAMALTAFSIIMAGSYFMVRYIIVKPVKHLKEVSDAISAGNLNVRSEIQTGDEFEDLSHAFNRMLRGLVSMQASLRQANSELDLKVDELAQANMALYESNRLKSDFLATMSHELRTPLNSILGFSEVLLSGQTLNDKQSRWVHNIQSSGEQLLNLINDILDLAKIEAGKMQLRIEEFSIRDVCEGMLSMFRPLAEKKNIELREQIHADIPVLRQDPGKIQQILGNLLSNALKFTPEGGRVLLKVDADDTTMTLVVSDTGVGIAPEDQELVFEKFRQAGNPLTRAHAGTGLGLSIVRELSKLLGGSVTLQSEVGRGSTFTLRLPVRLSHESRLEVHLADKTVDLSKAQLVDRGIRSDALSVLPQIETKTGSKDVESTETVAPASTPQASNGSATSDKTQPASQP